MVKGFGAHCLRILGPIPSIPMAFGVSRVDKASYTSSSEMPISDRVDVYRGVQRVKTERKMLLKRDTV